MAGRYPTAHCVKRSSGGGAPWGTRAAAAAVSLSQIRRWGSPLWGRPLLVDRTVHLPGDAVLRCWGSAGERLLSGWGDCRNFASGWVRAVDASMTRRMFPLGRPRVIGWNDDLA